MDFLLDTLQVSPFKLFLLFFCDKNYNCTFLQRFDEKKKLLTDHDAVLQTISEKLAECQQWQAQHKVLEQADKHNLSNDTSTFTCRSMVLVRRVTL